jgi:serine/threonine protein kinase
VVRQLWTNPNPDASERRCVNAEGLKLAANMNFRFPQFAPTSISSLIPHASPEAVDMINALIAWDPNKRPTAVQCLQMPYFQARSASRRILRQHTRIGGCCRATVWLCMTPCRRGDRALSGICQQRNCEPSTPDVCFHYLCSRV